MSFAIRGYLAFVNDSTNLTFYWNLVRNLGGVNLLLLEIWLLLTLKGFFWVDSLERNAYAPRLCKCLFEFFASVAI